MPILQAVVLAVVQGLTEYFPVSSSGHLVLTRWLFGWDPFVDEPHLELAFDVAVHLGTLTGAVAYFRRDLVRYTKAGLAGLVDAEQRQHTDAAIARLLVVATVPAGLVGVFLIDADQAWGSNITLVAVALILFGLLLGWADRRTGDKPATSWRLRDALVMGVAQAVALQPGVSRSGATITAARTLGFSRDSAARLAFLMSIPVTAGAVLYSAVDVFGNGGIPPEFRGAFVIGVLVSGLTGWAAVWATLRIVRTRSFDVFVGYRLVAGLVVLGLLATPWR